MENVVFVVNVVVVVVVMYALCLAVSFHLIRIYFSRISLFLPLLFSYITFVCARLAEHMNEHGANILGYVLLLVFASFSLFHHCSSFSFAHLCVFSVKSTQVKSTHTAAWLLALLTLFHPFIYIHSFAFSCLQFCLCVFCHFWRRHGFLMSVAACLFWKCSAFGQ